MAETTLRLKQGWQKLALEKGLLSETDLRRAQEDAEATRRGVDDVLVESGRLPEELIAKIKAEAAATVYVEVLDYQIDSAVLELVPEHVARKHTLIPLFAAGNALTVAMADPWNVVAIDEVRLGARLPVVQPAVGTATAIRQAIDRHYGHKVVEEAATRAEARAGQAAVAPSMKASPRKGAAPTLEVSGEVSVTKLVDALLTGALEVRASDIHLEPDETHLRVRYRIDGLLQEVQQLPVAVHEAVVSRIKLLAKLDITEHRLPQDGHLPMTMQNRPIDLRISTYPTVFGENVVIRLLDRGDLHLNMETLGLASETLAHVTALVQRPHGLLLVTGPTGSGKTTTLYAALTHINSVAKNIMTIEDPVEYHLPLIRQTQINVKAGVTFATGLRSLLRQDPDVIMVGEIRDRETAEIAIHAALTGHLVLSTLHTNDAMGAVARLLDMGVEPYLLASTLLGVIGQRLVRRICTHCQEGSRPPADIHTQYPELTVVYRGRGCRMCRQTGYLGRVGVFELFGIEEPVKALIAAKSSSDVLLHHALTNGFSTMRADGLRKIQEGMTTFDELNRVVPN